MTAGGGRRRSTQARRRREQRDRKWGVVAMLRILALGMLFSAALDATAALADARQDCQMLRGDAAIQACDLAIGEFPRDAEAYKNRGNAYRAKGDLDRAIADLTKAIEIDPKDADAYKNRGYAYHAKGDFDRAIADYTKAIEIDPKDTNAYNNRGSDYETKGDFERAIADFTKAIEIDPKDADAYINRCWLRATANRDLTLAFADCDTGLRLAPNDANDLDSLGFLYLRLGRLDEAIADYDAALKTNPRLAGSLYGRGLAKRKKGDQAGGDADIAAARAIQADIADEFAKYGMN
jgi:tetratricopeptide (TPR) repeat protein